MKYLALVLLVAVVSSQSIPSWVYDSFDHWMTKNNKTYDSPTEKNYRVGVYYANIIYIHQTNAAQSSYTLGANTFADLTTSEFLEMYTGINVNATTTTTGTPQVRSTQSVPASIDWSQKGAVTPIKNQGQCGSCWAFSTTGSLEGVYQIATGTLDSFSEQQLVDCSSSYGNEGCNGGLMDDAFNYVAAEGIELESTYPYKGTTDKCQYKASSTVFKISSHTDVTPSDNDALQAAVAINPVSIAIDAENIMLYTGGIFDDANCGTSLDHGVLAVGYGTDNSTDFWKVKNSWGASWGEAGYIRFARATGQGTAICGLNLMPSYPVYSASL